MLISTKYEEIYAPEIKDFVYVSDYAYTANEVLECEADILMTLDFNVTTPSPLAFLAMQPPLQVAPRSSVPILIPLPYIRARSLSSRRDRSSSKSRSMI